MQFFDLVREALPEDFKPEELTVLGKSEWWQNRQRLACAYALRKCTRLNWQAYLARYPDVASAGTDPILHFLQHGVYEGRKLCSWPLNRSVTPSSGPKVSVIIPNHNNDIYLRKCLSSVMGQTLRELEIIVVDDGSTDDSVAIIRELEHQDGRIKSIIFDRNKSQHMARKAGVAIARGDYVMFLDPDDTYQPNACEVAYKTISKGYDIVSFTKNVINLVNLSEKEISSSLNAYTWARCGHHAGDTLLDNTFVKNNLLYSLVTKIFDRILIQKAFEALDDGYFLPLEDAYAMLPIMHMARNLYKIPHPLYNHTTGAGTSTYHGSDEETLRRLNMGRMIECARIYCKKNNLDKYFEKFKLSCFHNVAGTIPLMGAHLAEALIDNLIEYYGLIWSVCGLARIYKNRIYELKKLLKSKSGHGMNCDQIRHIAIIQGSVASESQCFIQTICEILPAHGFKISLFLTEQSLANLHPEIACYRLGKYEADGRQHLEDLHNALAGTNPDLVLCTNPVWPDLPMQLLLLRFMAIPGFAFIPREKGMISMERSQADRVLVLRCLDKVVCASRTFELYLRSLGIDAVCISGISDVSEEYKQPGDPCAAEPGLDRPESALSHEWHKGQLARLLGTFASQSPTQPYTPHHYQRALGYMAGKVGRCGICE